MVANPPPDWWIYDRRIEFMAALVWRFGIGDPTPVGWLTVVAYAVAAACSAHAFLTARASQLRLATADPGEASDQRAIKQLWFVISITMVVLAVNKQLDFQSLLIQEARKRAYAQGWYDDRRRYQVDFIAGVVLTGLLITIGLTVWLRHVLRRVILAVTGLSTLVLFVVIRATSLHDVDRALSLGGDLRVNWVIELGGIGLIMVASRLGALDRSGAVTTTGDSIREHPACRS